MSQPEPSDLKVLALIDALNALQNDDPELAHIEADDLLLKFIGDARVTAAFDKIHKWYG